MINIELLVLDSNNWNNLAPDRLGQIDLFDI